MLKHSTFIPATLIVLLVLLALPASAEMMGDTAWVRTYPFCWDYPPLPGSVPALVADGSGNIYVVGNIYGNEGFTDIITLKYLPNGDTAWTRRYSKADSSYHTAHGIAVDLYGNVYVTGTTHEWWHAECVTIKYLPNGDTAWVREYGESELYSEALAIAVESSGNVYVAGLSYEYSIENSDYLTIKYLPSGDMDWVRKYDGPLGGGDTASAIAVDEQGNVYVTGTTTTYIGGGGNYTTIKYAANGDTVWVKTFEAIDGRGPDMVVDDSGNIYLAGVSGHACIAIKYYVLFPSI